MSPAAPPVGAMEPGALSALPSLAHGIGVLFLVCVGAYFVLRFLYGRGPQSRLSMGRKLVRIVDRIPLASARYLLIVEVTGKFYLLGVTDHSISFLTALDGEFLSKEILSKEPAGIGFAPFSAYLSALSQRWKKDKGEHSRE